jgi:hypothetical protein
VQDLWAIHTGGEGWFGGEWRVLGGDDDDDDDDDDEGANSWLEGSSIML